MYTGRNSEPQLAQRPDVHRCTSQCRFECAFHGLRPCGLEMRRFHGPGSAKAGFMDACTRMYTGRNSEPQLAQRPDVHRCTSQCRFECGFHVVPAMRAGNAPISGRRWLQFRSAKAGFMEACTRVYIPGWASPSWRCGALYMRVQGDRGLNAGSTACQVGKAPVSGRRWVQFGAQKLVLWMNVRPCTPARWVGPAGAGTRCTRV
jgi:hypothetical protein